MNMTNYLMAAAVLFLALGMFAAAWASRDRATGYLPGVFLGCAFFLLVKAVQVALP